MTEGQNLFHQLKTARDSGDFLNKHLQHQKQQSSDLQIFRKLMELLTKETVHSEKLMVEAAKAGADPKRHDPGKTIGPRRHSSTGRCSRSARVEL